MKINEALIMEFRHEMANTRKILERVPYDKATWKPHEKSSSLISLAFHIARIPQWVERVMINEEFDLAAPGAFPKIDYPTNTAELMAFLDKNNASALVSLENASEEDLRKTWKFHRAGQVFMNLPRVATIRNMAFNHQYHHRGQLSVYLRLLNVPIPGMYGPSADETM